MNLFFKKLFGKLHSTERMERHIMEEQERIARFRQVEKSPELKEYLELKEIVESKEFFQKKFNLNRTEYKSTPTYATIRRYKELLHDKQLQMCLELEGSKRLQDYLAFRDSEDYIKLQSRKEVRNSLLLRQMYDFERSKEYKSYLRYRDSKVPDEYKALVAEVATDEFKKALAFWSNPKRWKTTDEYQQEVRYKQLAERADIIFYLAQDVAASTQVVSTVTPLLIDYTSFFIQTLLQPQRLTFTAILITMSSLSSLKLRKLHSGRVLELDLLGATLQRLLLLLPVLTLLLNFSLHSRRVASDDEEQGRGRNGIRRSNREHRVRRRTYWQRRPG